ncbi:hypothetical protein WMF04_43195 [Sorangium sp. So ce260]|uniref:hypothetical protein n=1 Tax=Sorangium sp. So ce260 TaxID=3133291 RepID=UPI003F5D6B3C
MRRLSSLCAPLQLELYLSRGQPEIELLPVELNASIDRFSARSGAHVVRRIVGVMDATTEQQADEAGQFDWRMEGEDRSTLLERTV